jgi:hypothetical protein
MRVTAERLNEHRPIYVHKGTSEDRTNIAVPAPDPALSMQLPSGLWQVTIEFGYGATAGPTGIRTAWQVSSGVTSVGFRHTRGTGASATTRNSDQARTTVNNLETVAEYGLALPNLSQRGWGTEQAILQVAGGGVVTFAWAQLVAHASPAQVGGESYMRAERIG